MIRKMTSDDLYREEVLEARQIPANRKLSMGLELFDRVRAVMRAGIRGQFPDADEGEVQRILMYRLDVARRLENDS